MCIGKCVCVSQSVRVSVSIPIHMCTSIRMHDCVRELWSRARGGVRGALPPRMSNNSALLHSGLEIESLAEERESNIVYNRIWHMMVEECTGWEQVEEKDGRAFVLHELVLYFFSVHNAV